MKGCGGVDVIVPCYRYGHFLRECVESVLAETARPVRVLVIDDASPDDTPDVAADLARGDSRVTWRRHSENRGHIATYNEGIEWASADYMLILSADDLLTPGALARARALLDAHPDVVLTYGPTLGDTETVPAPDGTAASWDIIDGSAFLWRSMRAGCADPVETCTAIVRTDAQKRVGFYRAELPHAGDYEMWMRFAAHGKFGRLRAKQGIYRRHAGNMSMEYYANLPSDISQRTAAVESFIASERENLPDPEALRQHLYAHNAQLALSHAGGAFADGKFDMFDDLMAVALQLDPSVRFTSFWYKQRMKPILGPQLCDMLRGPVRRLTRPARAT